MVYSYSSRAAAAYVVYSCLSENPDAQLVLASTLKVPPEDNANSPYNGMYNRNNALQREGT